MVLSAEREMMGVDCVKHSNTKCGAVARSTSPLRQRHLLRLRLLLLLLSRSQVSLSRRLCCAIVVVMSLSAPLLPVRPSLDIATISRNPADYTRHRIGDITARHHSLNPSLHPYAQQREYTRALNAVKYERLFAKPFLYSLDGHRDAVCSLSRVRHQLSWMASGGCDGELKLWSLAQRRCEWSAKAHDGFVRSVCSDDTGQRLFTCSTDMTVKMWDVDQDKRRRDLDAASSPASASAVTPTSTYLHPHAVNCMDHHHAEPMFAAASSVVSLYSPLRPDPIHSFSWGADSINCVSFSPVEHHLLLSASSDRCVLLYDTRQRTAAKKILLLMQTNAIALSPLDAFYFLTASEDHNVYAFDLRRLDHAVCIHKVRRSAESMKTAQARPCVPSAVSDLRVCCAVPLCQDHVAAVMSVDYSPTGREFASGAYDRTVRLWDVWNAGGGVGGVGGSGGRSRDVYHTKRMQRVWSVRWSWDAQYVMSGSDDTNLRMWKGRASARLGVQTPRERQAREYRDRLVERYAAVEEVRRIHKHRHVPKAVLNARKLKEEMEKSEKRKEAERRRHKRPREQTAEGEAATPQFVSVKKKTVRAEIQ